VTPQCNANGGGNGQQIDSLKGARNELNGLGDFRADGDCASNPDPRASEHALQRVPHETKERDDCVRPQVRVPKILTTSFPEILATSR
jgi:hypothetical protein